MKNAARTNAVLWSLLLLLMSSASAAAMEYGFDRYYPPTVKMKAIIRAQMAGKGIERKKRTDWTTPNVLMFSGIPGGNVGQIIAPGVTTPGTEGDIDSTNGLERIAWVYRHGYGNVSINLNVVHRWKGDELPTVIATEIERVTH